MWRPSNWDKVKPETTKALGSMGSKAFPDDIFSAGVEAGADAMLKAVDSIIVEAEFRSLESLGLERFTEEQVLCFIGYLRQFLGKESDEETN